MSGSKAFNPDDIYNPTKNSGTTQTPSSLITDVVLTQKIQFKDGSVITGVSQDFRENQYDNCPSSYALFQGLSTLDANIKEIDPNNNFFRDTTVISLPLIDTNFGYPWEVYGDWSIVDAQAIYTGTLKDNWLKIPMEVIPFIGYYYLHLIVDRLDSGVIEIYDHADNLVTTIDKYGEYSIEMYIANADITTFRIVAVGVFPGDYINISYAGFHRVTDRFRDYFMYILRSQGAVGGGGLTQAEVQALINKAVNALTVSLTEAIDVVNDALLIHVGDRGNVHGLTLAQINAAHVNHTHPEFALIGGDLTAVLAHINDKETNPHGITPELIDAAHSRHTHTLISLGAAADNHNHDGIYLTEKDKQEIKISIPGIAQDIVNAALKNFEGGGGTGSSFDPFIIVPKETGVDVLGAEDSIITEPAIVFLSSNVLHQSSSDYDYESGLAGCNRVLINEESAAKAFSDFFGLVASFQEVNTNVKTTILTYRFHTERDINGYNLLKDRSNVIKGFPTTWKLYIDNVLIEEVTNETWTDLAMPLSSDQYSQTFGAVTGKEIKLVITSAIMDPATLNWGVRMRVQFADATNKKFVLNTPIKIGFSKTASSTVYDATDISLNAPGNEDTPVYLYLRKTIASETLPDDEEGNPGETVDTTTYSLQPDFVSPEFSQNYLGVDSLLNQYPDTNSHPTWGNITCSTEDPNHPARNLYNNDDVYYKGTDGDTNLTITHTFPEPISGLRGYRLVFDSEMINLNKLPNEIKVTVTSTTIVNNVSTNTDTITTHLVDYSPPIRKGNRYIWEIIKFPDDSTQPKDVSKVTINLKGTKGQPALTMSKFVMMLRGWQFNPYTGVPSSDNRCPIGRLDLLKLPATSELTEAVVHRGCPQGTCIYYPVEHFNILQNGTYKIPNLFNTTMITTEMLASDASSAITPLARVIDVTDKYIFVEVVNIGRYAVKVNRLW